MKTSENHLLIVDDDPEIRNLLKTYLQKNGYRVSTAAEGQEMWLVLKRYHINLIVLDLMLPGADGMELCRDLRAGKSAMAKIPIIMLTARGDEMDRILGLEMGADDYMAKPFSARELLARIKVVLRRVQELPPDVLAESAEKLSFEHWLLDTKTHLLTSPANIAVPLSSAEYRLLRVLLSHPNRVLSRDQLLELTQGRESNPFDRSIDVLIGRLRKRLQDDGKPPQLIQTVRGFGYQLNCRVTDASSGNAFQA